MTSDHSLDEARERAALYALGSLRGEEARDFEAHLSSGCAVCTAEVEAFAAVTQEPGRTAAPQVPRPEVRAGVFQPVAAASDPAQQPVYEHKGVRFVHSALLGWEAGNSADVEVKILSVDRERGMVTKLVRMPPGATLRSHRHADVEESYVLEGDLLVSGVL